MVQTQPNGEHEPNASDPRGRSRSRIDATDPPGSTWNSVGVHPERGMASLAGPAEVLAAARSILTGQTVNLDYPLSAFSPPLAHRPQPVHHLEPGHRDQLDDRIENLWLQVSSHVDGLRHRRHHRYGFFGGVPDSAITADSPTLGVNRWAESPIAGRGIMIDVARARVLAGRPVDHANGEALTVEDLELTISAQRLTLEPGDLIAIRTGWAEWHLSDISGEDRERNRNNRRYTGFAQNHNMLSWIRDHRLALVASDTFAFEVFPPVPESPFGGDTDNGMFHQDLIALLGIPLGELWKLDILADECHSRDKYEFLMVVKPLNLIGGVGSPANATAIL